MKIKPKGTRPEGHTSESPSFSLLNHTKKEIGTSTSTKCPPAPVKRGLWDTSLRKIRRRFIACDIGLTCRKARRRKAVPHAHIGALRFILTFSAYLLHPSSLQCPTVQQTVHPACKVYLLFSKSSLVTWRSSPFTVSTPASRLPD